MPEPDGTRAKIAINDRPAYLAAGHGFQGGAIYPVAHPALCNREPVHGTRLFHSLAAAHAEFLGTDERDLAAILRADDAVVRRRGLTHARIAQRLLALRQAGWEGLGAPVSVPPHFEVCVDAARGALSCPFGDQGSFAKVNTTVRNLESGQELTFTDLNIHLVAAHGFYEGHGAQFRLDPEQLMDTLEMGGCKKHEGIH